MYNKHNLYYGLLAYFLVVGAFFVIATTYLGHR
jgi:hypothetical protein